MKIKADSDTLRITELRELNDEVAGEIIRGVRETMGQGTAAIEFDLAQIRSVDCDAVNVLLSVHDAISEAGSFVWRVLNPPPDVRQLLELVRLHRLFEITPPRIPGMAVL